MVVTRQTGYEVPEGVGLAHSLDEGLETARLQVGDGQVFLVGGRCAEALRDSRVKTAWITEIDAGFECDTFFPELPAEFHLVETRPVVEENGTSYRFVRYEWAGSAV